jgi:hypothetical protein
MTETPKKPESEAGAAEPAGEAGPNIARGVSDAGKYSPAIAIELIRSVGHS